AVCRAVGEGGVRDRGAFQVEGLLQQPDPVGTVGAIVAARRHGGGNTAVAVHAPERVGGEVSDLDGGGHDAEEVGREIADVSLRDPRRAQAGGDVAGQDVLGLHQA